MLVLASAGRLAAPAPAPCPRPRPPRRRRRAALVSVPVAVALPGSVSAVGEAPLAPAAGDPLSPPSGVDVGVRGDLGGRGTRGSVGDVSDVPTSVSLSMRCNSLRSWRGGLPAARTFVATHRSVGRHRVDGRRWGPALRWDPARRASCVVAHPVRSVSARVPAPSASFVGSPGDGRAPPRHLWNPARDLGRCRLAAGTSSCRIPAIGSGTRSDTPSNLRGWSATEVHGPFRGRGLGHD